MTSLYPANLATPCWFNGALISSTEAKVSVFDHGLLYGDGIFEGLRFYDKKPFKLQRHLARLADSAQALALDLPFDHLVLERGVEQVIEASGLNDGYLRILVTRGEGNLGLNPAHCQKANVFILFADLELNDPAKLASGLSLISSSIKRVAGSGLDSRVKSLNYLHSIMAKLEANHAGADDALLLNQHGQLAECTAANIFVVKADHIYTPPCSDGALEGITRETVMELADALRIKLSQRSMSTWDIFTADECFITGSAARIMPVGSLDGRKVKRVNGPMFSALNNAFFERVRSA